jgi:putative endonuclease
MHYVYALKSVIKKYIYVGMTQDLNRGMKDHQKGYNKTTKPY